MAKDDKLNQYLRFHYLAESNPELLKDFIQNPQEVLKKIGIDEEDIKCPAYAHTALDRARVLARKIDEKNITSIQALSEIKDLVEEIFGRDFEVTKEPFGVRFSERVKETSIAWTATGTVSGTFGIFDDIRPDVDF